MARTFSIFLFCLLALHLSHFVIGAKERNYFLTPASDNKYSFEIFSSFGLHIDTCEFTHMGIGGIIKQVNTSTSSGSPIIEAFGLTWESSPFQCFFNTSDAKSTHFGKYEIRGYSKTGILLTTDIINLYKVIQMERNNEITVKGYTGEHVKISINQSQVLEACNNEMNKGLCSDKLFQKDAQVTSHLYATYNGYFLIYKDSELWEYGINKTGNCEYEIDGGYLKKIHDLDNLERDNQGFWYIEGWYGYLIVRQKLTISSTWKKLEANVGCNLPIHLNSLLPNERITCISLRRDSIYGKDLPKDNRIILKDDKKCEYVLNDVSFKDRGFWTIEYTYKTYLYTYNLQKTFQINVIDDLKKICETSVPFPVTTTETLQKTTVETPQETTTIPNKTPTSVTTQTLPETTETTQETTTETSNKTLSITAQPLPDTTETLQETTTITLNKIPTSVTAQPLPETTEITQETTETPNKTPSSVTTQTSQETTETPNKTLAITAQPLSETTETSQETTVTSEILPGTTSETLPDIVTVLPIIN